MSGGGDHKRKPIVSQPLDVKIKCVNDLDSSEASQEELAESLGVSVQTVRNWKKNVGKMVEFSKKFDIQTPRKRMRTRKIENEKLDELIWLWFEERRRSGVQIRGKDIQTQARFFHKHINETEHFVASNGWLEKWKIRHGLRCIPTTGENTAADTVAADKYIPYFDELVCSENLSPDQVFTCDETGLNYKMMPASSAASGKSGERYTVEQRRERITVMACSNASGRLKLPLVIVGKSLEPECLKNRLHLPVFYRGQKSASMNTQIFNDWFEKEFKPKVAVYLQQKGLPMKAVLFMDKISSHTAHAKSEGISTQFLPPNTGALLQPMNQGIWQSLKSKYREFMMFHMQTCLDKNQQLGRIIERIDLSCTIDWVARAWDLISPPMIQESWNNLWPGLHSIEAEGKGVETAAEISDQDIHRFCFSFNNAIGATTTVAYEDIKEWFHPQNLMTADEALNDHEIIQVVTEDQKEDDEGVNEKTEKAKRQAKSLLKYCKSKPEFYSAEIISQLKDICKAIESEASTSTKKTAFKVPE